MGYESQDPRGENGDLIVQCVYNIDNSKYIIQVDTNLPLNAQNISPKTKTILMVLKYNYWSTDIEKQHIAE